MSPLLLSGAVRQGVMQWGPLAGDKWEPTPSMKKILLTVGVLVVMLVGWMVFQNNNGGIVVDAPTPTVSPTLTASSKLTASPTPVVSKNIITYTDSGYVPNTITIKKGETVIWKNESGMKMWTASAVHPTHKAYSGTDIAACGTQTLLPMFDACAGIVSGQSWSFKFDNMGTWGYHNHSNASHWGKVVVE